MRAIDADALDDILADGEIKARKNRKYVLESAINTIRGNLAQMPTIESERKRGKWIIKDNPGTGWYRVTCSECGEDVASTAPCIGFYPNAKVTWDYCPNCGADMREVDDERPD